MPSLVSIVIPTHNRVELLRETLASVCAQTYPQWECWVVDDASEDNTLAVVEQLAREEPRIHLLPRKGEKGGAPVCRNQGFAASRGDYLIFLDSDDLLAPFCLEQRVPVMQAHPEIEFAVFPYIFFQTHPADTQCFRRPLVTAEDDLVRFLQKDNVWNITGPIWRRSALVRLGPWDETLLSGQEWDLTIRAICQGVPYLKINEPDWFWRVAGPRQTIGSYWFDPAVMKNRQAQLFAVARRVQAAGMLTTPRRYACLASFLQESFFMARYGHLRESLEFWAGLRHDPVLAPNSWLHIVLFLFLGIQRIRLVRRLVAWVVAPLLPEEFHFAIHVGKRGNCKADPNCRALRPYREAAA